MLCTLCRCCNTFEDKNQIKKILILLIVFPSCTGKRTESKKMTKNKFSLIELNNWKKISYNTFNNKSL